ncbi:MAG: hypothetical protein ABL958_08915, partial [Bdellovibrionia bacterium]
SEGEKKDKNAQGANNNSEGEKKDKQTGNDGEKKAGGPGGPGLPGSGGGDGDGEKNANNNSPGGRGPASIGGPDNGPGPNGPPPPPTEGGCMFCGVDGPIGGGPEFGDLPDDRNVFMPPDVHQPPNFGDIYHPPDDLIRNNRTLLIINVVVQP